MVAGILIITFSLALLIYWFRYSCILILRGQSENFGALGAAPDSRFSFATVQEKLHAGAPLDPLRESLDRDYRVLTYLIEHAAGLELGALEDRLLILDYRIMQRVYRLTRGFAPQQARRSLGEMATVLGILCRRMGAQAGQFS